MINTKTFSIKLIGLSVSLILMVACSSVDKTVYKDARTLAPLEIPPNLIAPSTVDGVEMTTATDSAAAGKSALIWERDGGLVLVLNFDYVTAISQLSETLEAQGFALSDENKGKGLYAFESEGVSKQLSIEDRGVKTLVTVIGEENRRDHSGEAYQVLSGIHAKLR